MSKNGHDWKNSNRVLADEASEAGVDDDDDLGMESLHAISLASAEAELASARLDRVDQHDENRVYRIVLVCEAE
jgi:hypothetical protein